MFCVYVLCRVYISKNRRVDQKYTPGDPNDNLTFVTEFTNVTECIKTNGEKQSIENVQLLVISVHCTVGL